jgi:putative membrane protein
VQIVHFSPQMSASPFSGGFRSAVVRVVITGIAVFLAVAMVPGIEAETFEAGLAAVLVLTILNLVLRPILLILTLPLIVLSLGLFLVVLNALLLEFTAYLVKGFSVSGFWPAVGGAVVISIVTTIVNVMTVDRQTINITPTQPRQPKIINPSE